MNKLMASLPNIPSKARHTFYQLQTRPQTRFAKYPLPSGGRYPMFSKMQRNSVGNSKATAANAFRKLWPRRRPRPCPCPPWRRQALSLSSRVRAYKPLIRGNEAFQEHPVWLPFQAWNPHVRLRGENLLHPIRDRHCIVSKVFYLEHVALRSPPTAITASKNKTSKPCRG